MIPNLLARSDVMCTGWQAAICADAVLERDGADDYAAMDERRAIKTLLRP